MRVDLAAGDPLGERPEQRIGCPPRALVVDAGMLGDALHERRCVQDLDVASARKQRGETSGQLGDQVAPLVVRNRARQGIEDRAHVVLCDCGVDARPPGHATQELVRVEALGRRCRRDPRCKLRRQLRGDLARLLAVDALGERLQRRAAGALRALAAVREVLRDDLQEALVVHDAGFRICR